jgi:predicted N-formylglutamate amidohydrolase
VTEAMARQLGVPAILGGFSRLLIDPNRGEDDPTLIMRLSDGTLVPGNRQVDAAERQRRIERYYRPYHRAVGEAIDAGVATGRVPAILSIHSFTPIWRGHPRPWQVGILWDNDPRLPAPMIEALAADRELTVGDNEPYSGALANDTLFHHATRRGLANALVELRQDLIASDAGAAAWAIRLADIWTTLASREELRHIRHYGSRSGPVPADPAEQ